MTEPTHGDPHEGVGDEELIRRVRDRDHAALRLLFDRHAPWLTLRLRRRTSDADVVATVLQDTFVAVWRKPEAYRGDGELGAWLWGIAIRRMISHYRGHREPHPASSEVIESSLDVVSSAEDELLVGIEHGDVGAALGRLSPQLQEIVRATLLDGLSTREAARLLSIPQGTAKSRLRIARSQLRQQLMPVRPRRLS
jgi:RNA polymerase sigma factor (sigma-70 family)